MTKTLDRLLALMAGWWAGRTLADMAREHGISRQRAGAVLKSVGCTASLRRRVHDGRPDSARRAAHGRKLDARAALAHPSAYLLAVRQRAALAWRAQGLVLADIGRRMGTTAQGARHHLVSARWRLEAGPATEATDIGPIDFSDVIEDLTGAPAGTPPDSQRLEALGPHTFLPSEAPRREGGQ